MKLFQLMLPPMHLWLTQFESANLHAGKTPQIKKAAKRTRFYFAYNRCETATEWTLLPLTIT